MHVVEGSSLHLTHFQDRKHTQCHHLLVVVAVVGIIRDIPDLSPVSAPPPPLPLPQGARTACCRTPPLLLFLISSKVTTLRPVPVTFPTLPLPLLQVCVLGAMHVAELVFAVNLT